MNSLRTGRLVRCMLVGQTDRSPIRIAMFLREEIRNGIENERRNGELSDAYWCLGR